MRKTGLILTLAVLLASCSNPASSDDPYGDRNLSSYVQAAGNTVIEQLAWVQANAAAGGIYNIWARGDETFHDTQVIQYLDRPNVTVRIQSYGDTRRTLTLNGNGEMFLVKNHNVTLILQNIVLHGAGSNFRPLVLVNRRAGLVMLNDSVIRGNTKPRWFSVDTGHVGNVIVDGGVLTMRGNAAITSSAMLLSNGLLAQASGRVYMYDTALIYGNFNGVIIRDSTLTMRGNSEIRNNLGIGVMFESPAVDSRLIMRDNTVIRDNHGGGVSPLWPVSRYDNALIQ